MAFLSLDDDAAGKLLAGVPEEARGECWWLVLRDGTPVPGNDGGGVVLLTEMDVTRLLGHALRKLRLSRLIDSLDNLFARNRTRLGRLVPEGPAPRRFP